MKPPEVEELPIPAQYNIKADNLAEKRNIKSKREDTESIKPLLPESRVLLYLNGKPVTGNYTPK